MTTSLDIITLGQHRIECNGTIIKNLISTKTMLLLVYLAMHPGKQNRRKIASMLWSETSDQQALRNLRTILTSIRQQLPDIVIATRTALELNPNVSVAVDAITFEQECKVASQSTSLIDLCAVAELYQGIFLEDVVFRNAVDLDAWVTDKQQDYQRHYAGLLQEILELASTQGKYELGLQYAYKLVKLDPFWNVAQRQLMQFLVSNKRVNEALMQFEEFSILLKSELDVVPDEKTIALYEQIRTANSQSSVQEKNISRPTSIILSDMPFIEPTNDFMLIQRMLNTPQCHLLTIYGISGVGKTALATQIAYKRQHLYEDGAYLVSLKDANSIRDLPYLISVSLGLNFNTTADYHEIQHLILDFLNRHTVLLVLDNYEHLLPNTSFIERILEEATNTQVIITSQSPLNLFREWLIPLKGLPVPDSDDEAMANEAVQLFAITAQRINPHFNLGKNLADVAEICRLVDGLPMAIILAASWTQVVPNDMIIEAIIAGQEFVLPLQQKLPQRHQSLEMMLEYTWNTLNEREQYSLIALSIFNTSFGLDEVQQICEIEMNVLAAMLQKSLIQKFGNEYRMHQLIWRYARQKLLFSNQKPRLSERFTGYIINKLSDLQNRQPMIHEYLMTIDAIYSRIWNYNWMSKSFQIRYLLETSQFLMAYWQVSRTDNISAIDAIFNGVDYSKLAAKHRALLILQLARISVINNQSIRTTQNILMKLEHDVLNLGWHDMGTLFMIYYSLTDSLYLNESTSELNHQDQKIIRKTQLKLTFLYMDLRDYNAIEEIFVHILSGETEAIEKMCIFAIRGAIAATKTKFDEALVYFVKAQEYNIQHDDMLTITISKIVNHIRTKVTE